MSRISCACISMFVVVSSVASASVIIEGNPVFSEEQDREKLNHEDLSYLAYGGSLYGSGAGGGFLDALRIAQNFPESISVNLIPVAHAKDDATYVVAGGIGAPLAIREHASKLIEAAAKSAQKLAELTGGKLGGVLSVETGPINSIIATGISAKLDVPLVDADGAGRTVPSLRHLTYAHEEHLKVAPLVLTNLQGEQVVLHPKTPAEAEHMIQETISKPNWNNIAGLALWAQSGKALKESQIVEGTFSRARDLGMVASRYGNEEWDSVIHDLETNSELYEYYEGVITGFETKKIRGVDVIDVTIESELRCHEVMDVTSVEKCVALKPGEASKQTLTIRAVNENLIMHARAANSTGSDEVVAVSPHIISYAVRSDTLGWTMWLPLNNGDTEAMEEAAKARAPIVVHVMFARPRLYTLAPSFLKYLKDTLHYQGDLVPEEPAESDYSD